METLKIIEITDLDPIMVSELTQLLQAVVEDGASIGFLPPVSELEGQDYWNNVLDPSVKLWAAMLGDKVAGTVQLHLAMKSNGLHRAEVAKLMVHPATRRLGIARKLMCVLEEAAVQEGRSLLVLDTREGDPSNRLYKSLGYIEAGVIPEFARSANGSLDATVLYYKKIE